VPETWDANLVAMDEAVTAEALAFTIVILAASSCAAQEHPEGIVERWLLALNQGSAGEPLRYADADVTDALVPEWRSAAPARST
jgi:hypothetical protein